MLYTFAFGSARPPTVLSVPASPSDSLSRDRPRLGFLGCTVAPRGGLSPPRMLPSGLLARFYFRNVTAVLDSYFAALNTQRMRLPVAQRAAAYINAAALQFV